MIQKRRRYSWRGEREVKEDDLAQRAIRCMMLRISQAIGQRYNLTSTSIPLPPPISIPFIPSSLLPPLTNSFPFLFTFFLLQDTCNNTMKGTLQTEKWFHSYRQKYSSPPPSPPSSPPLLLPPPLLPSSLLIYPSSILAT